MEISSIEGQVLISGSNSDDCEDHSKKDTVGAMEILEGKCIRIIDNQLGQCKKYIARGNDDMALHSLSIAIPYTFNEENVIFSKIKPMWRSKFGPPKKDNESNNEQNLQESRAINHVKKLDGKVYYNLCKKRTRIFLMRAEIKYRHGDLLAANKEVTKICELSSFLESVEVKNAENLLPALLLRASIFMILGVDAIALDVVNEVVKFMETNANGDDERCEYFDSLLTNTCYVSTRPILCASEWHRLRRDFILDQYPNTSSLYEDPLAPTLKQYSNNKKSNIHLLAESPRPLKYYFEKLQVFWDRHLGVGFTLCLLLISLVFIQSVLALAVASTNSYIILFTMSATVGAFISYGFQAINHDLCHIHRHPTLIWICMLLSSSMCNFPWAFYYKLYHAKHHSFTGGSKDRDGDILFQPWHSPPCLHVKFEFPKILNSKIRLTRWYQYFPKGSMENVSNDGQENYCSENFSTNNSVSRQAMNSPVDENHTSSKGKRLENDIGETETRINANPQMSSLSNSPKTDSIKNASDLKGWYFSFNIDLASHWLFRWFWSIIFAWGLYAVFHIRKYQFDAPHRPMLKYEGLWLCTTLAFGYYGGAFSLLYLWWSCAFSLGACGHPYLGFWLIQHASIRRPLNGKLYETLTRLSSSMEWPKDLLLVNDTSQPTVSYYGSMIWNMMNFGELWHVEHHDFPMIPAIRYPMLQRIAKEYYQDLVACGSVMKSIREWIFWDDEDWMYKYGDFAAKEEYLSYFYAELDEVDVHLNTQ